MAIMGRQTEQRYSADSVFPAIFIFLLVFICYSNTFNADFQFDDKPGIVNNQKLHIDNIYPTTLWKTFFAKPGVGNKFYRPVANLTFALNWYLGGDNPPGYHLVNLTLHAINTILLYLLILQLLETPSMNGRYDKEAAHFIAIVGALIWSLNPIQTQAVTYIVQRMAVLSAFFYLMGIYLYLDLRQGSARRWQVFPFLGCLLCYLLAVGSKENAIMLPGSLLLVEWLFISSSFTEIFKRKELKWVLGTIAVASLFLIIVFAASGKLRFVFVGYDNRPFSMAQRLMTEARIVIWYLSLIFYPMPFRLSVEHDVQMSMSLLSPWTTLPSLLLIGALVIAAIWRRDKNTLTSYAILFFLLNHIVESSVIPIEPIFEHRNYLPSCFLFVPVAAGIKSLMNTFKNKRESIQWLAASSIPLIMILFGIGTYIRNEAWHAETTLWADAMKKAQQSSRPLVQLAQILIKEDPRYADQALALYKKSLLLRKARKDIEPAILGNMGGIYAKYKGDRNRAIAFYRQALEQDPNYIQGRYDLSVLLTIQGEWKDAGCEIDYILNKGLVHEDYYNLKGIICLWQNHPEEALLLFRKSLRSAENKSKACLGIGASLCAMGFYDRADRFLRLAYNGQPDSIVNLFLLVENAIRAGDMSTARNWADRLLSNHSLQETETWLKLLPTFFQSPPVSIERIAPLITEQAKRLLNRINKLN